MVTLLGLVWMPHSDVMGIEFNSEITDSEIILTKSVMLSLTFQIFDPLSLLVPFVHTVQDLAPIILEGTVGMG